MPAEHINKLARMFQDIKVSEDLNNDFKESHRGSAVAGEEGVNCAGMVCMGSMLGVSGRGLTPTDMVNIKVLNAGAWSRSSERVPVSLPTEVSATPTHLAGPRSRVTPLLSLSLSLPPAGGLYPRRGGVLPGQTHGTQTLLAPCDVQWSRESHSCTSSCHMLMPVPHACCPIKS